jgi:hypothetical protein
MERMLALLVLAGTLAAEPLAAQAVESVAALAPELECSFVTQANADASAGTPNVQLDGSPLPGFPAPVISA